MTESSDSAEPGATLPAGLAETLAHAPAPSEVDPDLPARIGPYSIIDRLGQGGMGSVYLAQQHEPVERRVALKVITLGKDTREVVARFEAERQTLALMNHPYIAKVFDAGATAEGRPYFAMEHTAGDPITVFCDRHRLGIRARLQLFVDVCHAVQHAHQKGVIHRDLKPSNILVGQDNGTPAPKVIDFGIAKAMGESSADVTALTRANEAIGTPLYMSPEQAGLAERDIDTRSDVYALGVILYELLSGTLPYFDGGLGTSTWEEVRRAIRDDDPLTPSSRLSRLNAERGAAVARARQIERTALRKQLRGDLDWIVLKALAKDRTRRYGSTSELADDIGRHLEHQPVVAGPPGAAYRVRKFVRRHAWGVAAALAFGLLLVGFPATTAVQAARVARERDRSDLEAAKARAINEFMQQTLLSFDPADGLGRDVSVQQALESAVPKIEVSFADQPDVESSLKNLIGTAYMRLGRYDEAEVLLRSALEIRERVLGPEHAGVATSLQNVGHVLDERGNYDAASGFYRRALALRLRLYDDDHPDVVDARTALGRMLTYVGDHASAEEHLREALRVARTQTLGDDAVRTQRVLQRVVALYEAWDKPDRARVYQALLIADNG